MNCKISDGGATSVAVLGYHAQFIDSEVFSYT